MNCSSYSKNAMVLKVRGYTRFLTHSFFIYMTTFVILFFIIKIVISKNFLFFTSAARFKGVDLPRRGRCPAPKSDAGRIGLIIHRFLKSKKVFTSEARLYGFLSSNARFKGVNLAPKGEGGAEGDE